jgi:hypothetical protein
MILCACFISSLIAFTPLTLCERVSLVALYAQQTYTKHLPFLIKQKIFFRFPESRKQEKRVLEISQME